jgi:acetate kinase
MNINNFYTAPLYSFSEILNDLAHSSTKDQFEAALMKLDIGDQDPAEQVAYLLENHARLLDFKDVQTLNQITKNISKYLTSPNDAIHKIQAIYQNIVNEHVNHFLSYLPHKLVCKKLREMMKQAPLEQDVQLIELVELLFKSVKDQNDRCHKSRELWS